LIISSGDWIDFSAARLHSQTGAAESAKVMALQRKPVPLARYHFFIPQIQGSKLPSQDWIASSPAKAGSEAAFGVAYKENRYRWRATIFLFRKSREASFPDLLHKKTGY